MDSQSYRPILKRVGIVLIVVGLFDIAWMVNCIVHQISYSSSLNLFAVIAGILLMRGNLRTAAGVRWFGTFGLSAAIAGILGWPAIQPLDLTLTRIRLDPVGFVGGVAFLTLTLAVLAWGVKELGRPPVQAAIDGAGVKRREVRWAMVAGVLLILGLGVSLHFMLGGESAKHAISMAEQTVGPGYRLRVTSLQISSNANRESVSGVVTAWNDKEIREIPIHWEKPN
jgi:hypothetical protein